MQRIYFDNAATTPLDPRVREAMAPFEAEVFGNPSSLHADGRRARRAIDEARAAVARLINARPDEVYFTSSGTEADNLALHGVVESNGDAPVHVVAAAIEHPAVIETCRHLESLGAEVTYLRPEPSGIVEPAALAGVLRPSTRLVSIMAANNVTGVVQPTAELAALARANGSLFHTDAVQAAGRIPLDVESWGVDLLSLSAHKIYGPKGVGALYARKGVGLSPILFGGGQEGGVRSSTENVAGIAGMGKAAEIAGRESADETCRVVRLRDRIIDGVLASVPGAYLIGDRYRRLPGHVCLGVAGREGEAIKLLLALDEAGVSLSSGSACSSHHAGEPSAILTAMGFDAIRARGSLRISLGRFNTEEEVEAFLRIFPSVCASLRRVTSSDARDPQNLKGARHEL